MPTTDDLLSVAQAAAELGLSRISIRQAIMRRLITPVRLDGRTNLIPREELERYRRDHLRTRGPGARKRTQSATSQAESESE